VKKSSTLEDKRSASALRFSFSPQPAGRVLLDWYLKEKRALPWRLDWERTRDPWFVWVSEIMLQQTVIKAVVPVYDRFIKTYPDFESLAAADTEAVRQAVRGLGYYRRFAMLHAAAKKLSETGQGYPTTFDSWKELPGIGDYTASAISSICFDVPVGVVDGNVERVLCRLLDLQEAPNGPHLKKPFKLLVQELLPVHAPGDFNQGIMELGQRVCTPTSPNCEQCPLKGVCLANERSTQSLAPGPKKKQDKIEMTLGLQVLRRRGKTFLTKRPMTAKFLKETWGFPTAIQKKTGYEWDGEYQKSHCELGLKVGHVKHTITKHKLSVSVHIDDASKVPLKKLPTSLEARWVDDKDVDEQLVANLDRKAWTLAQRLSD
jgi:A/G-specific adenine glycosylase